MNSCKKETQANIFLLVELLSKPDLRVVTVPQEPMWQNQTIIKGKFFLVSFFLHTWSQENKAIHGSKTDHLV